MIDALLQLGQEQRIPIGIEYIDAAAFRSRITLHVRNSTVGALLDAITHPRGYSWFVYGDVVIVTHKGAPQGRKNLLDTRIREFAIAREVTLQAASLHVHDRAERRDGSGGRFRVLGRKDDRGHRGEDPGPAHGGPGELSDRGPRRLEDPDRGVEENSRPVTRRNCESAREREGSQFHPAFSCYSANTLLLSAQCNRNDGLCRALRK